MKQSQFPFSLTKHWTLKLLALVIGAALWYFVVGEDQIDITINVPIEVHNLPPNLVIANQFKKDIEVSIRGPRRMVQEVRRQNISRPVDLSQVEAGAIVITNDDKSIPFPQGIKVQRLQPTNITLLVDQLVEKQFPITAVTEGIPNVGYALAGVTLDPPNLTVTGPNSVLEQQSLLKTFVINLDGLDKSTTLQVQLDLDDSMLNLIGETVVTVKINVNEVILKKTVRGIPVNVRGANHPMKTAPTMVTVEAAIPENLIRETPELAMLFRAFVNADTKPNKEGLVPVAVNGISVPGHSPVKVINVKPEKVRLIPVNGD